MHFDDISWLAFVRRSMPEDDTWLMQQHLTVACEECLKAHSFWAKLDDLLAKEGQYEPDASDVRVVTSAFAGANSERKNLVLPKLAVLTFDSFQDSAPVGFRRSLVQARHVVFRSEGWTISLRIKQQTGNQVSLTGHISEAELPLRETSPMEVQLLSNGIPNASVTTSLSGEFHLQYSLVPDVRLLVNVSDAEALEIPLPVEDLASEDMDFEE